MSLERTLQQRSNNCCELCGNNEKLSAYEVPDTKELALYACDICITQMNDIDIIDPNHWRCLNDSMVAKQGTAVRNIRLDHENAEYIEGKVDGQQIVIITQYVKKI